MSEKKKPTISDVVVENSKIIAKHLSFDDKTNTVTIKDNEDLFAKTLPDGLDLDTAKKVTQAISNYGAASALAFGEKAIEHMKQNDSCDSVSATFNFAGNNHFSHTVTREKTYPVPNKPGESITKKGVLQSSMTMTGCKPNRGELSKVVKQLEELGAEQLINKK